MVYLDFARFLKSNSIILLSIAVFLLASFFFFPKFYSATDEHEYLKNSVLLQQGSIAVKDIFSACRSGIFSEKGYISTYPIGESLFLVPFTWLGSLDLVMASGMFLHLLNFLILILILRHLGIRKEFAMLYLFFPAFLWASRTLYPHLLVLATFLTGAYFYLGKNKSSWIISGFSFALAYLIRQDSIIGIIAFGLPLLFLDKKKFVYFIAGALPFIAIIPFLNLLLYGSPIAVQAGYFSFWQGISPIDVVLYALLLMAFYPLLLISPLFLLKKNKELFWAIVLTLPYLVIAASMGIFDFEFSIETLLTARMRYLIPVIGLLLIPYSIMLSGFFEKLEKFSGLLNSRNLFVAMLLVFSVSTLVASYKHAEFINNYRYSVFESINANIPENALAIGSSDDEMYFIRGFFSNKKYLSIDLNQCLAGNPEKISISSFIGEKPYLIMLYYPYQEGRDAPRQGTVNKERQKMADFINANKENLELVYGSEKLNLSIYKFR